MKFKVVSAVVVMVVSILWGISLRGQKAQPLKAQPGSFVALQVQAPDSAGVNTNVAIAQFTNIYKICVDDSCVDARDVMRWMQKQIAEMKGLK